VKEALNSFKVSDLDQKAILEMLNGIKKDIVEKNWAIVRNLFSQLPLCSGNF
jgi:hypothetical protein